MRGGETLSDRLACGVRTAAIRLEKWAYLTGLRSRDRLALPGFLGIGAQKSGTTWLHVNLACHPELYLPAQKEVHYFDRHFDKSLEYYSRRFRPGDGRI